MDAGTPCPVAGGLIGAEAASYWQEHPHLIPEGSRYREDYMQQVQVEEPKGDTDAIRILALWLFLCYSYSKLIVYLTLQAKTLQVFALQV